MWKGRGEAKRTWERGRRGKDRRGVGHVTVYIG